MKTVLIYSKIKRKNVMDKSTTNNRKRKMTQRHTRRDGSKAGRPVGFFFPKGALTHHLPARQAVVAFPVVRPCALREGLRSLRRAPANAAGTAAPIIIVCAEKEVWLFPAV